MEINSPANYVSCAYHLALAGVIMNVRNVLSIQADNRRALLAVAGGDTVGDGLQVSVLLVPPAHRHCRLLRAMALARAATGEQRPPQPPPLPKASRRAPSLAESKQLPGSVLLKFERKGHAVTRNIIEAGQAKAWAEPLLRSLDEHRLDAYRHRRVQ